MMATDNLFTELLGFVILSTDRQTDVSYFNLSPMQRHYPGKHGVPLQEAGQTGLTDSEVVGRSYVSVRLRPLMAHGPSRDNG